jgi:hypothetical protein
MFGTVSPEATNRDYMYETYMFSFVSVNMISDRRLNATSRGLRSIFIGASRRKFWQMYMERFLLLHRPRLHETTVYIRVFPFSVFGDRPANRNFRYMYTTHVFFSSLLVDGRLGDQQPNFRCVSDVCIYWSDPSLCCWQPTTC